MRDEGVFICVEGLDGCGKTTQAKLLARRLRKSRAAVYTAEPSNGKIGKLIKRRYLHADKRGSAMAEALLFAADRLEHLRNEVLPAVKEGKVVVSDRYVYSSLAYQGAAGLDLKWIEGINKQAIPPSLAIFIDVEPETVIHRLKRKRSVMENLETQLKVRQIYLKFVDKGELVRVDGNKSRREVAREVAGVVEKFLKEGC